MNTDIEFIEGGVRYRRQILDVEILEGDSALSRIFTDIYESLKEKPPKDRFLLVAGCDERKFEEVGGKKIITQLDKLRDESIKTHLLVQEGDTHFIEPAECYRWVPAEIFSQVPNFVYGDKYAIILWGPPVKIIRIHNADIADSYRKQFYAHWNRAKIPVI